MDTFDLAIIGAGPAGLAAAITAAPLGVKTIVLDEQPEPGGQIYRSVESLSGRKEALQIFGEEYVAGLELVNQFRASGARYERLAQVWQVDRERNVHFRSPDGMGMIPARQVLIATGAMERPVPVPGWTLPGVMSCGGAQTLLKSAGLAPGGRVVLAGNGPLLLLVASQLLRAGVRPAAVLETGTDLWRALPHFPRFLFAPGYFGRGLAMLRELRRARVVFRRQVSDLRIAGTTHAEAVEYRRGGITQRVDADVVLLHQGVVPNSNLSWSLRCEHDWHRAQRSFHPRLDPWGRSSVDGVLIAGDSGGIVGARGAELSGRLCALAAAANLGRITVDERDIRAARIRRELARHLAARPFLDAYYRPRQDMVAPRDDDTIVCRCEEVSAGEIRRLVLEQNCPGPNQMKSFSRSGMGPCQGRMCGLTVVELISECRKVSPAEVGYYRIRSPVKPITVGELAGPARGEAG